MSGAAEDAADIFFPGAGSAIEEGIAEVKDLIPKPPGAPGTGSTPSIPGGPNPDVEQSPAIKAAVDQARKRLRAARGRSRTILTAGSTLGEPSTRRRTILGG